MNEEDLLDAYHGRHPYSYGSRKGVKDFVNVDDRELETVLSKSEIYTGYKEFKNQNLHHLSEPMVAIIFGKQT